MTTGDIPELLAHLEAQQHDIDWDTVLCDLQKDPHYSNVRIESE